MISENLYKKQKFNELYKDLLEINEKVALIQRDSNSKIGKMVIRQKTGPSNLLGRKDNV